MIKVLGVDKTNELVKHLSYDDLTLIINLGYNRTKLPQLRNHIIELDFSTEDDYGFADGDWDFIDKWFISKASMLTTMLMSISLLSFDNIIVRCDACDSRSQALATAMERKLDIKFEGYRTTGNLKLLETFEWFFNSSRTQEEYRELRRIRKEQSDEFMDRFGINK